MQNIENSEGYGRLGLFFHWCMAFLMVATFILGEVMEDMPRGAEKLEIIGWHFLAGMTVLILAVPRVGWRFSTPPLPEPGNASKWQKPAARAGHGILYALMFILPVTGFLVLASVSKPLPVLGLFDLQPLFPSRGLHEVMEDIHGIMAKGLLFVVILHLLATGWHHLVRKDNVAARMLPFLKNGR